MHWRQPRGNRAHAGAKHGRDISRTRASVRKVCSWTCLKTTRPGLSARPTASRAHAPRSWLRHMGASLQWGLCREKKKRTGKHRACTRTVRAAVSVGAGHRAYGKGGAYTRVSPKGVFISRTVYIGIPSPHPHTFTLVFQLIMTYLRLLRCDPPMRKGA
jgi:hypothetical protein